MSLSEREADIKADIKADRDKGLAKDEQVLAARYDILLMPALESRSDHDLYVWHIRAYVMLRRPRLHHLRLAPLPVVARQPAKTSFQEKQQSIANGRRKRYRHFGAC